MYRRKHVQHFSLMYRQELAKCNTAQCKRVHRTDTMQPRLPTSWGAELERCTPVHPGKTCLLATPPSFLDPLTTI